MTRAPLLASLTLTLATGCIIIADDTTGDVETGVTAELPCGDYTVATASTGDGSRLAFCVLEAGLELVAVGWPTGTASGLDRTPPDSDTCALDVYLEVAAPDAPVPVTLVDSCAALTGRPVALPDRVVVDDVVLVPVEAPRDPTSWTWELWMVNDSGREDWSFRFGIDPASAFQEP